MGIFLINKIIRVIKGKLGELRQRWHFTRILQTCVVNYNHFQNLKKKKLWEPVIYLWIITTKLWEFSIYLWNIPQICMGNIEMGNFYRF